ncbi:MAG: hypothetical protein AAFU85_29185 [Planctomycetota bacterium]
MLKTARKRSIVTSGLLLGLVFVCGGATCAPRRPSFEFPPPPVALTTTPDLAQVVAAVNRTSAIRELSTNTASIEVISMPGTPKLSSSSLSLRRDRDFRLRAGLPIVLTPVLDMGSNQEVFWFEVPEGIRKVLYFARHDQYRQQLDRAILPVDPSWVMDAVGLVQIDPNTVVAGPVMRPDGKLEIRNTIAMPTGVFQRVCYIDAAAGHVTDQFLFAPSGVEIARSNASDHEFFPAQQCSLPHTVQLKLTPAVGPPLEMKIDVGTYTVNQLLSGDPNLFVMPQTAGAAVDLTTLSPGNGIPVAPVGYQPSGELGPLPYRGTVAP